jgi:hypothetical protein
MSIIIIKILFREIIIEIANFSNDKNVYKHKYEALTIILKKKFISFRIENKKEEKILFKLKS